MLTTFCVPEEMKQNKRLIERAARKIERERAKIEQQEKKHKQEITKLAKGGQHVMNFILAEFDKF